jgi:hypothetical protein
MPDTTPIYGFTYPCPGDTVDATDFQLLATQIDTQLAVVDADYDAALNRRNVDFDGTLQNIAAGVATAITTPQYTLPVDGVFLVSLRTVTLSSPATFNALRTRGQQAAVSRFGFTSNTELNTGRTFVTSGPIVGTAGQIIRAECLFSGAGTLDVSVSMSVRMVCRIA